MESIEKLRQLKSVLDKRFFQEHCDFFWGHYQQWFNVPERQWDGRDYFHYVVQNHSRNDEERCSLSEGLKKDIENKFSQLEEAFLTDIIKLNVESQNNLIQIIRQKLKTIRLGANELSLPRDYRVIILNHFNACEDKFIGLLDEFNYPRISEHGFYYKKLHTKEGRRAFKKFYNEVVSYGLISGDISEDEFKEIFSQRKLIKKIIWSGSPEEAQYFFTTLDAKEYVETKSIWITVGEHFLIRKKRGGFFEPEKLRGLPKLNEDLREEKDRMTIIKSTIEILNV